MSEFTKKRTGIGTREWSEYSLSIGTGCSAACIYCWARADALRFNKIKTADEWNKEEINEKAFDRIMKMKHRDGVGMFPTCHDITKHYLSASIEVIDRMLQFNNSILITTKPRMECIEEIVKISNRFLNGMSFIKNFIMFRFTITSLDDELSKLWEPGAPLPTERLECLKMAYKLGFQTSVSCEPFLDHPRNAIVVYKAVAPYVTDKIWIGKMNKVAQRIYGTSEMSEDFISGLVKKINDVQSDDMILALWLFLNEADKKAKKIEWKDSIKKIVLAGST